MLNYRNHNKKDFAFIEKLKHIKTEIEKRFILSRVNATYKFPRKQKVSYKTREDDKLERLLQSVSVYDLKTQRSISPSPRLLLSDSKDLKNKTISRLKVLKSPIVNTKDISEYPMSIKSLSRERKLMNVDSQGKSIKEKAMNISAFLNSQTKKTNISPYSHKPDVSPPRDSTSFRISKVARGDIRDERSKTKGNLRVLKAKIWNFEKISKSADGEIE